MVMEDYQLRAASEDTGAQWKAFGVALVLIALALGAAIYFTRTEVPAGPVPVHPYAENIVLSGFALSEAEGFVAGVRVLYLEGKVANTGPRTVKSMRVEAVFRNSLGEIVQREARTLLVITQRQPYIDAVDLSKAPLQPNQVREFRLSFDHISADWNRGYPELRVIDVELE
jgi:hypothetical protein